MVSDGSVGIEFHEHRRNLPHWQQGGSTYFITFRSGIGVLPPEARMIVKHHILFDHTRRYELLFGVIMPDHVHLLIRPTQTDDGAWHGLPQIMKGLKGSSARNINQLLNRTGSVWQDEYFDRLVRDEDELHEKWQYMWNNPLKAGLATSFEDYPFYVRATDEMTEGRKRTD